MDYLRQHPWKDNHARVSDADLDNFLSNCMVKGILIPSAPPGGFTYSSIHRYLSSNPPMTQPARLEQAPEGANFSDDFQDDQAHAENTHNSLNQDRERRTDNSTYINAANDKYHRPQVPQERLDSFQRVRFSNVSSSSKAKRKASNEFDIPPSARPVQHRISGGVVADAQWNPVTNLPPNEQQTRHYPQFKIKSTHANSAVKSDISASNPTPMRAQGIFHTDTASSSDSVIGKSVSKPLTTAESPHGLGTGDKRHLELVSKQMGATGERITPPTRRAIASNESTISISKRKRLESTDVAPVKSVGMTAGVSGGVDTVPPVPELPVPARKKRANKLGLKSRAKHTSSLSTSYKRTAEVLTALGAHIQSTPCSGDDPSYKNHYGDALLARQRLERTSSDIKYRKIVDEDSDDLTIALSDDSIIQQLKTILFASFLHPFKPAPTDLSQERQDTMNKLMSFQYELVKERMCDEEDYKDVEARVLILLDTIQKLHTQGIASADLNLKEIKKAIFKTKNGHIVEPKHSFIARTVKIANFIRDDKYVAMDVLKAKPLNDLVYAPDAYEKLKQTNWRNNRSKAVVSKLGREVQKTMQGDGAKDQFVDQTGARGQKVKRQAGQAIEQAAEHVDEQSNKQDYEEGEEDRTQEGGQEGEQRGEEEAQQECEQAMELQGEMGDPTNVDGQDDAMLEDDAGMDFGNWGLEDEDMRYWASLDYDREPIQDD